MSNRPHHSSNESHEPAGGFAGLRLTVQGQVQGVGFRPFVFRLARSHRLQGFVRNTPEGVRIEVHGPQVELQAFLEDLQTNLPPLAFISAMQTEDLPFDAEAREFVILASTRGADHSVLISPDMAVCHNCRLDMDDPTNRRHLYPFTNCTDCGPRYTITRTIPYDRGSTSMSCFPMCPDCRNEYHDPLDRRFHAQPNACPVCGPCLWSSDSTGQATAQDLPAVQRIALDIAAGRIVAVKGLGGFHLACNALDSAAVAAMRLLKNRPSKPLAVMVPDLQAARQLAVVSAAAEQWLTGPISPIVLAPKKSGGPLPEAIAPDSESVGLMLPYTPLHRCLLHFFSQADCGSGPPALVMTSGNASQEPIALGNREALDRLGCIADSFLLHDRDILVRCDDSVLTPLPETGSPLLFRRARGFTPKPLQLHSHGPCVLGLGAEAKSTVCLTKGDLAFVSQHIGDLENQETFDFFLETIEHLKHVLQVEPSLVVRDLHPDYLSSRFAREHQALPVLRLQHHYAHIHAVLAENGRIEPALGLALDGTGLGEDGSLWGGELLFVDPRSNDHHRLGHFLPMRLPGGEAAITEPWRMAQSLAHDLAGAEARQPPWPWVEAYAQASRMIAQLLEKNVNCLRTTSCGRLFDAVSALLGLCFRITYEGQAAVLLETIQDRTETFEYPCPMRSQGDSSVLDTGQLFAAVYEDWARGLRPGLISRRFHLGLCQGIAEWTQRAAKRLGIEAVALSGGVLQNRTLAGELPKRLMRLGLKPLVHTGLPPNDACISLGQAAFARTELTRGALDESCLPGEQRVLSGQAKVASIAAGKSRFP